MVRIWERLCGKEMLGRVSGETKIIFLQLAVGWECFQAVKIGQESRHTTTISLLLPFLVSLQSERTSIYNNGYLQ
jgi:hypothetical protein